MGELLVSGRVVAEGHVFRIKFPASPSPDLPYLKSIIATWSQGEKVLDAKLQGHMQFSSLPSDP